MIFESNASTGRGFLAKAFAEFTGAKQKKGIFTLPDNFGKGYIKSFDLGPAMFVMVHQYVLKKDVTFKRMGVQTGKEFIGFSFRNVLPDLVTGVGSFHQHLLPSVQVSSGDVDLEFFTPAGAMINTVVVNVHVELLKDLLNKKGENTVLENIVLGNQTYLYEELISSEIQKVAGSMLETTVSEVLNDFYLKLKAEELVYLFFAELLKRERVESYPLNVLDVKMMYKIRDELLLDLSIPPNLSALTSMANMSESKMNRLFKQIFGNSIYNYYQNLRMKEAARLIKEKKLSVSEVGYRLGFSNLSHFSRLFEKHIGMKPKKYSA